MRDRTVRRRSSEEKEVGEGGERSWRRARSGQCAPSTFSSRSRPQLLLDKIVRLYLLYFRLLDADILSILQNTRDA